MDSWLQEEELPLSNAFEYTAVVVSYKYIRGHVAMNNEGIAICSRSHNRMERRTQEDVKGLASPTGATFRLSYICTHVGICRLRLS